MISLVKFISLNLTIVTYRINQIHVVRIPCSKCDGLRNVFDFKFLKIECHVHSYVPRLIPDHANINYWH